jgi:hypothetical protein
MGWARWTAVAGFAFVALYVAAFSTGIEVGKSDREIVDYDADSAAAALSFVVFALDVLVARRA